VGDVVVGVRERRQERPFGVLVGQQQAEQEHPEQREFECDDGESGGGVDGERRAVLDGGVHDQADVDDVGVLQDGDRVLLGEPRRRLRSIPMRVLAK